MAQDAGASRPERPMSGIPRSNDDFRRSIYEIEEMAGRHFYKDLEPSDREAFKRGRQALASYTTAGFWLGGILAPLPLLRGRYALTNLRKLPPLMQSGRPNREAISDRIAWLFKAFFLGMGGSFAGASAGLWLGKRKFERILDEAGATGRVMESMSKMKQEWEQKNRGMAFPAGPATAIYGSDMVDERRAQAQVGSRAGPSKGSSGSGEVDGNFVPDENYYSQQTVNDSSFEANQGLGQSGSSSSQSVDSSPSRWEQVRRERGPPPSTWERIRQQRDRSSASSGTSPPPTTSASVGERADAQRRGDEFAATSDPRPQEDKEKERKAFEELLDRERRMGEEGFVDDGKRGKW